MLTLVRMFDAIAFEKHAILVAASSKIALAHRVRYAWNAVAKDLTMGFFAGGISLCAPWIWQSKN